MDQKITGFTLFHKLLRWELQEYLSFPVFELMLFIAIYSILNQSTVDISYSSSYSNLHWGVQNIFFFMMLAVGAFLSRSFSGSISKGEIKMLLSCPLKRTQIFASKFIAMFLTFFCVYSVVFSVQIYLRSLSVFEPMFYVSIMSFAFQLLLMCSIATLIGIFVKNEMVSILTSILLLYGIENLVSGGSYLSYTGRFKMIFGYFSAMTHGTVPNGIMTIATLSDILLAVCIPIIVSVLLITAASIYFKHMEID